ncbi:MAG TPA: hypothetical protein VLF20_01805 [Patescibacteria group bacterium]|nr:hypothetical protein [Patescibacteria group bacterium]
MAVTEGAPRPRWLRIARFGRRQNAPVEFVVTGSSTQPDDLRMDRGTSLGLLDHVEVERMTRRRDAPVPITRRVGDRRRQDGRPILDMDLGMYDNPVHALPLVLKIAGPITIAFGGSIAFTLDVKTGLLVTGVGGATEGVAYLMDRVFRRGHKPKV